MTKVTTDGFSEEVALQQMRTTQGKQRHSTPEAGRCLWALTVYSVAKRR